MKEILYNHLKGIKRRNIQGATKATVRRIDTIIILYSERKISNITTAKNLIKGLTSDNKKQRDKALQKYKDDIQKLQENKPLNERMAETRKRKRLNTYLINFLLYTIRKPKNEKMKPAFTFRGQKYYAESFDIKSATINVNDFPKESIHKRVYRYLTDVWKLISIGEER